MKKLLSNLKNGEFKIQVENLDDLWYLSQIIEKGDLVSGQTFRKVKLGGSDERSSKINKRKIFLKINVEKVEFHKYSNILRVSGTITEAPEDIPNGSYHTFNIEENTIFTIIKRRWLSYQLDKLKEACEASRVKILLLLFDREEAIFAISKKYGYEILTKLSGEVEKKAQKTTITKSFYSELITLLNDYVLRHSINSVIVASPSFWKDEFNRHLKDEQLRSKIVFASCSDVSETSISEVLRRPEVQHALRQDRIAKETNLVESLLKEISKDNLAAYGLKETKKALDSGAVRSLLLTDLFILEMREKESYDEIEKMLNTADSLKAEIHIISSEHDAGKRLDGLGGIAAILRYKLR